MNLHHSQGLWDSHVLIFIFNKIFICSCLYNIRLFAGGIIVLYLLYDLPCVLETVLKQLSTYSLPSLLDGLRNGVQYYCVFMVFIVATIISINAYEISWTRFSSSHPSTLWSSKVRHLKKLQKVTILIRTKQTFTAFFITTNQVTLEI